MSAADTLQIAQKYESEQHWGKAAEEYMSLASKQDDTLEYFEKAAWCYSRNAEYIRSIKCLDILREKEPKKAKWPYMIGYQYYAQKNWNEAITWFEKALQIKSDYFVVKYRLAYSYYQSAGNYKQLTKAEYWKALGHLKECHELWNTFGVEKQKREKGIYFSVNFLHGKMLMNLERHRDIAIALFEEALKLDNDDEACKYNLAKTYYLAGDYESAKKALPLSKKYYVSELHAYINAKLENYSLAIAQTKELIQSRNKDYLFAFLANLYLENGENRKAFYEIEKALKLGPNNHKNYYVCAKILYSFGLFRKALDQIEKAIQIKKMKYDTTYEECNELKTNILSLLDEDYTDDEDLLNGLYNRNNNPIGRESGVIKMYNQDKGFGFINSNSKDIFFHISNLRFNNIRIGDRVNFLEESTPKGIKAIDVNRV